MRSVEMTEKDRKVISKEPFSATEKSKTLIPTKPLEPTERKQQKQSSRHNCLSQQTIAEKAVISTELLETADESSKNSHLDRTA